MGKSWQGLISCDLQFGTFLCCSRPVKGIMMNEVGASQKNKGKMGDYVKYLSKTLKWHYVLGNDVLKLKRKKRAEERQIFPSARSI